jgi:hypothetical protein
LNGAAQHYLSNNAYAHDTSTAPAKNTTSYADGATTRAELATLALGLKYTLDDADQADYAYWQGEASASTPALALSGAISDYESIGTASADGGFGQHSKYVARSGCSSYAATVKSKGTAAYLTRTVDAFLPRKVRFFAQGDGDSANSLAEEGRTWGSVPGDHGRGYSTNGQTWMSSVDGNWNFLDESVDWVAVDVLTVTGIDRLLAEHSSLAASGGDPATAVDSASHPENTTEGIWPSEMPGHHHNVGFRLINWKAITEHQFLCTISSE